MDGFQKTVLGVALIILSITLIALGVMIFNSRNSDAYPPELSNCPDYFEMRQNKGEDMCYNIHGLGNGDQDACLWFKPTDNIKTMKKFTKECKLTWDGLDQM